MSAIPYRPEVDGLRAVAILAVVAFHLAPRHLPAGYLGVDVFFVISGYLITSIILAEGREGRFSLSVFWERRIRRLFPAAAFVLLAAGAAALALGYPQHPLSVLGRQMVAAAVFMANVAMLVISGDYWAPGAETLALLHHWSLAVEEQFYLLYPPLLVLLGIRRTRRIALVLAGLLAASCVAWAWARQESPGDAFYLLHFRAWELLAGALVALAPARRPSPAIAWSSASVIMAGLALPFHADPGRLIAQLLVVGSTASMLLWSSAAAGPGARLSKGPVVAVGKASYSLYLWHWPCIVFAKAVAEIREQPWIEWMSLPALLVGTLVSYGWVEPLGRRITRPFAWGAGLTAAVALAGLLASFNEKEPDLPGLATPHLHDRSYDCVQRPQPRIFGDKRVGFVQVNHRPALDNPGLLGEGIVAGKVGSPARWFLLGDSHGLMWARQFDLLAARHGREARVFAAIGTNPLLLQGASPGLSAARRREYNEARLAAVASDKPEWIVLTMRWDAALESGLMPQVDELLASLRQRSPGSRVLLLGQPPVSSIGINVPQWISWRHSLGMPFETAPLREGRSADALVLLREIAVRHPGVRVWDPSPILTEGLRVRVVSGDRVLYRDDDHLSDEGAAHLIPYLGEELLDSQR